MGRCQTEDIKSPEQWGGADGEEKEGGPTDGGEPFFFYISNEGGHQPTECACVTVRRSILLLKRNGKSDIRKGSMMGGGGLGVCRVPFATSSPGKKSGDSESRKCGTNDRWDLSLSFGRREKKFEVGGKRSGDREGRLLDTVKGKFA